MTKTDLYMYRLKIFSIILAPNIHAAYILGNKIADIANAFRRAGVPAQSKQGMKMAIGEAERMANRLKGLCNTIEEDHLSQLDYVAGVNAGTFASDVLITANQNIYLQLLIHNACIADEGNLLKIESMLKAMATDVKNPSYIDPDIIKEFDR